MMMQRYLKSVCSLLALFGCVALLVADTMGEAPNDGGYNRGEQKPGNAEGGTRLWLGHIAVHPSGDFFISRLKDGNLVLGDVASGKTEKLDGLRYAERIVFAPKGKVLYATQTTKKYSHVYLLAYDLEDRRELWREELAGRWDLNQLRVDYEPTTHGLLLSGLTGIMMYDAKDGSERWSKSNFGIRDVDLNPRTGKAILTIQERWSRKLHPMEPLRSSAGNGKGVELAAIKQELQVGKAPSIKPKEEPKAPKDQLVPTAQIWFVAYDTGKHTSIEVPNCGGELIIAADGRRGFLAPTTCTAPEPTPPNKPNEPNKPREPSRMAGYDPVSVIDLVEEKFVVNLPGFGPVALSRDGSMAVAFMDRQALDPSLFGTYGELPPKEGSRYLLMFIDTDSLKFTSMDIGEQLPRFAVAPDGTLLLLDVSERFGEGKIRILDIKERKLREVSGSDDMRLDHFAMTPDSAQAFVLHKGLYRLSFDDARIEPIRLSFEPSSLNISPKGDKLFLKDEKTGEVHLYCIEDRSLCGVIRPELTPTLDQAATP